MKQQWLDQVKQRLNTAKDNATHSAEHNSSTLYDLSNYGVIRLSGDGCRDFLQGQITADIKKLSANKALFTAVCNPQGRIYSLFLLIEHSKDELLCLLPASLVSSTVERLKKFAVFYKADISDVSAQWAITGTHLSQTDRDKFTVSQSDNAITVQIDDQRSIQLCSPETALSQWQEETSEVKNYELWLQQDIEQGLPRLYPETIETFLPHNLNLIEMGAVSFDKGCYTGQEVVARMHYKGKLKSHMRILTGESQQAPAPGSPLYGDEKKMGDVICAVSNEMGISVLALCKDKMENATKIQCDPKNLPILKLTT
ncbi:YgfZ/GcvT domain-containing protein [Pleionea mediterranea]|uniref:GCVT N-terminal domain-containing protein n=1 Tax=Pleionea mediterranea TaxID=523701 RepID=A0A316G1G5_9GAMM|nr:folate-binding protein YgfZ [Pleionea mediterranea]PWK54463.1 hypothetical protein C8D97_101311 [Pleionea mediterranea]